MSSCPENDQVMVARAAGVFERAADQMAEQIGDEFTASGLIMALGAFVETRWGTHAVHALLTGVAAEVANIAAKGRH